MIVYVLLSYVRASTAVNFSSIEASKINLKNETATAMPRVSRFPFAIRLAAFDLQRLGSQTRSRTNGGIDE